MTESTPLTARQEMSRELRSWACSIGVSGVTVEASDSVVIRLLTLAGIAGHQLVPVEPTRRMMVAANKASLSTAVLMDDTPFACERATYTAALKEHALEEPVG